jgi:hypothetical protein
MRYADTRPDGASSRAMGDWLSGRAPRSHRGGHWFDPSIAHEPARADRWPSATFRAGRSAIPGGATPPDPCDLWLGSPVRVRPVGVHQAEHLCDDLALELASQLGARQHLDRLAQPVEFSGWDDVGHVLMIGTNWPRADQRVLAWPAGRGSRDGAWPRGGVDRRHAAGAGCPARVTRWARPAAAGRSGPGQALTGHSGDGARTGPSQAAATRTTPASAGARCTSWLGGPTLGEHGAQLRFDRGQVPVAEGEGPVLREDLWRLVVGQQQDEPAGG